MGLPYDYDAHTCIQGEYDVNDFVFMFAVFAAFALVIRSKRKGAANPAPTSDVPTEQSANPVALPRRNSARTSRRGAESSRGCGTAHPVQQLGDPGGLTVVLAEPVLPEFGAEFSTSFPLQFASPVSDSLVVTPITPALETSVMAETHQDQVPRVAESAQCADTTSAAAVDTVVDMSDHELDIQHQNQETDRRPGTHITASAVDDYV